MENHGNVFLNFCGNPVMCHMDAHLCLIITLSIVTKVIQKSKLSVCLYHFIKCKQALKFLGCQEILSF